MSSALQPPSGMCPGSILQVTSRTQTGCGPGQEEGSSHETLGGPGKGTVWSAGEDAVTLALGSGRSLSCVEGRGQSQTAGVGGWEAARWACHLLRKLRRRGGRGRRRRSRAGSRGETIFRLFS